VQDIVTGNKNNYTATNNISEEQITLGRRYDNGNAGQAYQQYWDWIRVRKYLSITPTYAFDATEENISVTINNMQCYKTGTGYTNCGAILYGTTLEKVRANCTATAVGGTISNVEFILININDNNTYFDHNISATTGDIMKMI
jgi:hypothetical protein